MEASLHASACLHPLGIRLSSRHDLILSSSDAGGSVAFLHESQISQNPMAGRDETTPKIRSSINLRCRVVMRDVCGLNGRSN